MALKLKENLAAQLEFLDDCESTLDTTTNSNESTLAMKMLINGMRSHLKLVTDIYLKDEATR